MSYKKDRNNVATGVVLGILAVIALMTFFSCNSAEIVYKQVHEERCCYQESECIYEVANEDTCIVYKGSCTEYYYGDIVNLNKINKKL